MVCLCCFVVEASAAVPVAFSSKEAVEPGVGLGGNEVGDIVWDGRWLWVVAGDGISKRISGSGLNVTDWETYTYEQGLGRGSVSAVAVSGDTIWVATVTDTTIKGQYFQMGQGLSASFDGGNRWSHFANDRIFGELPDPPPHLSASTGCFGLAIDGRTLWATFFAGSLMRTRDAGATWERVLPDSVQTISYMDDQRGLGHRTFSVIAYGDTVWVGTAAGVAKSTDGGATWTRFRSMADEEGQHKEGTLPGNWVVTLARQRLGARSIIWAGTKSTGGAGEYVGVTLTEDGGQTWQGLDLKVPTWNFAFRDSMVWAATEDGLYSSDDVGEHWTHVIIEDPYARERIDRNVVGVAVVGDTLWVGAEVGLAQSVDLGVTWSIIKMPVQTVSLDEGEIIEAGNWEKIKTYAFPNPFSPDLRGDVTRIQYSLSRPARVTITIYDFAGVLVTTLIDHAFRQGGLNRGENWDGRNGKEKQVANGTYFYRIETDRGHKAFGKIVVLD